MQESQTEQEGGQHVESNGETTPVSDSVPVRPSTSADQNKDWDNKETDNVSSQ